MHVQAAHMINIYELGAGQEGQSPAEGEKKSLAEQETHKVPTTTSSETSNGEVKEVNISRRKCDYK